MIICNGTILTVVGTGAIVVDSLGIVMSILLLTLISLTPVLRNYSGFMLGGEHLLCIVEQISSICTTMSLTSSNSVPRVVLFSIALSMEMSSLILLVMINGNIFLSIYKVTVRQNLISLRRVIVAILVNVSTNILLGILPMSYEEYFTFDCFKGGLPFPNTKQETLWHPVLLVLMSLACLCGNTVFLVLMYKGKGANGASPSTQKQIKLARFIFILSIMHSSTLFGLYSLLYCKILADKKGISVDTALFVFVNLNKLYMNFRIFFYLPLYRPLFETLKKLITKSRRVHAMRIAVVAREN